MASHRADARPRPQAGRHAGDRAARQRLLPSSLSTGSAGRHAERSSRRRRTLTVSAATALALGGLVTGGAPVGAEPAVTQPTFTQQALLAGAATGHLASSSYDLLQRGVDRPSRSSAREALANVTGAKVRPARSAEATQTSPKLAKLAASAEQAAGQLSWFNPLAAGSYRLTARFGQCSGLWSHCHTGLDFAASSGTPIRSIAAGTVTSAGYEGAYGYKTVVTLSDGTEVWYCHQTSIGVSTGQQVAGGEIIGTVGSTGNTTGPHLHLEVRPGGGDAVDPYTALQAHGITP